MKNYKLLFFTVLIVCVFFVQINNADIVYFKDGRTIEGKVKKTEDNKIILITKYGTKEFLLEDIEKIEITKTKEEEYKDRLDNLDTKDVDKVLELVEWCKNNSLEKEAKKHLKDIIELDPNNEIARKLLGFIKYDGKWLTKDEIEKIDHDKMIEENTKKGLVEYNGMWVPKEDIEKLEKGLVKYNGEWVTVEDKERLENNLVLYNGEWIPSEDAKKMEEGFFKVDEKWLTKEEADKVHSKWENAWILKSKHIKIKTSKNHDYIQKMLYYGEFAYDKMKELFGREPDLTNSLITVYVLSSLDEYNQIGNELGDEKSSFYSVFFVEESNGDGPISVTYALIDPQKGDTDNYIEYTLGLLRHAVIQQYIRRIDKNDEIPPWFAVGQASMNDRFWSDKYISYYIKQLNRIGGFIKLKQFFGNFGYTEQEIYVAALICCYLHSSEVKEIIKEKYDETINSIKQGEKIGSKFSALEKALIKSEKQMAEYLDKF